MRTPIHSAARHQFNITETGSGPVTVTTTSDPDAAGIYTGRITLTTTAGPDRLGDNQQLRSRPTPWRPTPATIPTVTAPTYAGGRPQQLADQPTWHKTLNGNWSTNSLKINSTSAAARVTIGPTASLTLASGGLLFTGSNNYTISGGNLAVLRRLSHHGAFYTFANYSELILHQYGTGTLTINSVDPQHTTANGGTELPGSLGGGQGRSRHCGLDGRQHLPRADLIEAGVAERLRRRPARRRQRQPSPG